MHSIGAALFARKDQIHWFKDIGYEHEPFQHCPLDADVYKAQNCDCNPPSSFSKPPCLFCNPCSRAPGASLFSGPAVRGGSVRADADVRVQLVDHDTVLICVNSLRLAMLPEVGEHVQVMTRSSGRGQDVRRRGMRRQRAERVSAGPAARSPCSRVLSFTRDGGLSPRARGEGRCVSIILGVCYCSLDCAV